MAEFRIGKWPSLGLGFKGELEGRELDVGAQHLNRNEIAKCLKPFQCLCAESVESLSCSKVINGIREERKKEDTNVDPRGGLRGIRALQEVGSGPSKCTPLERTNFPKIWS